MVLNGTENSKFSLNNIVNFISTRDLPIAYQNFHGRVATAKRTPWLLITTIISDNILLSGILNSTTVLLCCLPTPMTLASGGSPMFPHVVHQPASPSIWPAVQSLRRGLSTNPGVTMWCVCGCS